MEKLERISNLSLPEIIEKEQDNTLTRYEASLAEFPIFLLSKHPIPDLGDSLTYTDTIYAEGKPVERTWRVSWSKRYGPGTQSTSETFFALFQMWASEGFDSPWIHFGSIRSILLRKGVSTGANDYKRVIRDLHCLCNIYIEAKNAFYDSEKKKYVDASFHLFENLVLEKEAAGNPTASDKGFIKAHPILLSAARKNCFALGIEEKAFFQLPGLQQRLYLYLRKMFTFQQFHVRNLADLAKQIPLFCASKKKVKQQVKKASQAILSADLIPGFGKFRFYTSPSGSEMIRFERDDAQQVSLFDDVEKSSSENGNFELITEVCKDEHSFPFYRKIAVLMSTDDICRALSESKNFAREVNRNGSSCSIPKVFTTRIVSIARERGINLLQGSGDVSERENRRQESKQTSSLKDALASEKAQLGKEFAAENID